MYKRQSVDNTFQQIYLDFGHGGAAIADVEETGNEGEYKLTITANQPVGTVSYTHLFLFLRMSLSIH